MSNALLNAVLRHQSYVESLKEGQSMVLVAGAVAAENQIKAILSAVEVNDLGDLTKTALTKLAMSLAAVSRTWVTKAMDAFRAWLLEYLKVDRKAIPLFVEDVSHTVGVGSMPEAVAIYKTAMATVLPAGGITPLALIASTTINLPNRIKQAVLAAAANHDSVRALQAALVGTRANGFRDGTIHKSIMDMMTTKRTIIQQFVNMVQDLAYSLFSDRYMWVSVLDSVTTQICRTRNGRVYLRNEGPLPPAHYNCRSTTVPLIIRQPIPNLPRTFYEWIKGENDNFVSDILPERLAMALRTGKARAGDFPGLRQPKPLTLDQYQLRQKLIAGER